ncbi:hypothetical protein ManeNPV_00112 [Malacosoma neustria nucleopolyhedrovirus]|uniref:hypothetical protein n=1 Tax=Malacosoma neustria nuclear polyhedrosis virus TaxID=38012 RepID=UPI000E3598A0|nr:hypothetical protein ManeNPV_00112 [Malacosoma neustria nucleopolyhedrovirus]AUF81638.1 hypothetical protein ManeNPV_00112 [Malacosoma neustria nucleopolyhedrovirus]
MAALLQLPREIYDMIACELDYEDLLNLTRATGLKPRITAVNEDITFVLLNYKDEYLNNLYTPVWIECVIKYKITVLEKLEFNKRMMKSSCANCNHELCCKLIGCKHCCDCMYEHWYIFRRLSNMKWIYVMVRFSILKIIYDTSFLNKNRLQGYKRLKYDIAKNLCRRTFNDIRKNDIKMFKFCIHVLK